ncbi:hypothetical protein [Catellatospora vulcania]|uniref:hypothetical protein n=1 Tax=Catellatospora vulcania TaxID=1460450 RepID=UPI0012D3EB76|nr:hypothetical protein [Catellatospora vulcania]
MRRFEVVANHDVWDVLDGDRVVGIHQRKPDAVWQAAAAALANAPSRLAVIAADGRVENTTDFNLNGTAVPSADSDGVTSGGTAA